MTDGLAKQKKQDEWMADHTPVEVSTAQTVGGWSGALTVRF